MHFCQATSAILRGIAGQNETRKDAGISVTNLTGCLRASFFNHTLDYHWYPSRLWPAYRGTLGHLLVERSQHPEHICERRFARELAGHILTGQPDEYNPRRKLLIDYKTKREFPNYPTQGYVEQLNGYALILAKGYDVKSNEEVAYEVEQLGLVFLTMDGYCKIPVPLWELNHSEDLLGERLLQLAGALSGGPLPPRLSNSPKNHPLCSAWCPHLQACLES